MSPTVHHAEPPRSAVRRSRAAFLIGNLAVASILATACGTTIHPSPEYPPTAAARTGAPRLSVSMQAQNALAEQPMPSVPLSAAVPIPLSTRAPGTIALPTPTYRGPAGVPTGLPHSPNGALAQLAEIDKSAMQPANLATAATIVTGWAAPGGPTPQNWTRIQALSGLLTVAAVVNSGPPLELQVRPAMGLIKGALGEDFTVVCVDLEVDVVGNDTLRTADADCQRMVWQRNRWVIGPGTEPYPAPAVWPETDTAIEVGYLDLSYSQ